MEVKREKTSPPAPFLIKTFEMVDHPSTNEIVSWSFTGQSFVVWDPSRFSQNLLPKYFKHNNFSSFVRQLNTYGFRKIDPEQWEFANPEFLKGQRHLLTKIHRRKPIHSHTQPGNDSPLPDDERFRFQKRIEALEHEKSLLEASLHATENEKQKLEVHVSSLALRFRGIESRQEQLISLLDQYVRRDCGGKKRKLADGGHSEEFRRDGYAEVEKVEMSLVFWEGVLQEGGGISHMEDCGWMAGSALSTETVSSSSRPMDVLSPPEVDGASAVVTDRDSDFVEVNDLFWQRCLYEE